MLRHAIRPALHESGVLVVGAPGAWCLLCVTRGCGPSGGAVSRWRIPQRPPVRVRCGRLSRHAGGHADLRTGTGPAPLSERGLDDGTTAPLCARRRAQSDRDPRGRAAVDHPARARQWGDVPAWLDRGHRAGGAARARVCWTSGHCRARATGGLAQLAQARGGLPTAGDCRAPMARAPRTRRRGGAAAVDADARRHHAGQSERPGPAAGRL